jgi:hypothetical protein
MRLVCASVDARELLDLVGEMIRENITFFKYGQFICPQRLLYGRDCRKDSFGAMLTASLDWDTMEQFFFWSPPPLPRTAACLAGL